MIKKRPHLDVRLTEREYLYIKTEFEGQNVSEIVRKYLLGRCAEKRQNSMPLY